MNNNELLIAISDLFEKKIEGVNKKLEESRLHTDEKFEEAKLHTKEKFEEVKSYTGVLVEDLRGDVKAIAEGHDILNHKIDRLDKRVDGLEGRMTGLEVNVAVIKDYIIGVDAKLNEHEITLKKVKLI